jgi:RimJ/RimL family protein N-acetyltransferase
MYLLQTSRLRLRKIDDSDAPFIFILLNDPDFLRNIGDRGVHREEDAHRYIANGPQAMYRQHGFGLYLVELEDGTAIGTCGLIKRDGLEDVDIGFAFLPAYRGRGYAQEAAQAVMDYGREKLGLRRILAIVTPANGSSIRLLGKIGLSQEGRVTLPGGDEELLLMAWEAGDSVEFASTLPTL